MVTRRKFLRGLACGVGTGTAVVLMTPTGSNAYDGTSYWASQNSNVDRYAARLNASGQHVEASALRTRLAGPIRRAALANTSPAWAVMGRLARNYGVGLVFTAVASATYRVLTTDGDRVAITQVDEDGASPADWDWIAGDVPRNSVRKYANGIVALVTWESGQFLSDEGRHQYGDGWEWVYSRIRVPISSVPGAGAGGTSVDLYAHVWRLSPTTPGAAAQYPLPATQTQAEAQAELAKLAAADSLTGEAASQLLTRMLADEFARDPAGLPDPTQNPFLPSDIVARPDGDQFRAPLAIPAAGQDPALLTNGTGTDPSNPSTGTPSGTIDWGQFAPPSLPSLPSPSDFFFGWLNPMKALAPLVPDHVSTCPVVKFTWYGGTEQKYDGHCAVAESIKPTLRLGAAISAGLGAFWTVVGA